MVRVANVVQSLVTGLVFICLLLAGDPLAAEISNSTHNRCWSDAALKVKPGERRIRRKRHSYKPPDPAYELAPFASIAEPLRGSIRHVKLPRDKKWIALTLDFCEQPHEIAGYDGAIIDYLRQENVTATLFLGGKWMRSHEERTLQLMADPRFELANHGEAHRNLRSLSGASLKHEIQGPQQTYEALRTKLEGKACFKSNRHTPSVPKRLTLFRFPYGACNARALTAVNDEGLLAIQWDFSSWDSSRAQSAARIAHRLMRDVRSGSIILAHGNGRGHHTNLALRIAIPQLRKKGFRFVTVSQLLAAGEPVIKQRCYNFRPGDTDRYDKLFRRHRAKNVRRRPGIAP